jgi:SAM-dependent methyltransferase
MATSFGSNATVYDQLRPSYPTAVIDGALARAEIGNVLDLGAGTGILTGLLIRDGLVVVAVDPDTAMLDVLVTKYPGVATQVGNAEQIPADAGTFDAVFVGQAFHWFTRPAADLDIARVLRPGGIVAILTNINPPGSDWEATLHERVLGVPQERLSDGENPLDTSVFRDEGVEFTDNPKLLSREQFLSLPSTWSWCLTATDEQRAAVATEAAVLADEISVDGVVTLPYVTRLVTAVRK